MINNKSYLVVLSAGLQYNSEGGTRRIRCCHVPDTSGHGHFGGFPGMKPHVISSHVDWKWK